MFDKVFRYKHYAKEFETGPLSKYLDEFSRILFERGHSRRKVRNKFIILGQLSRWMKRNHVKINQLNEIVLRKFIKIESKRVVCSLSDRGHIASLKTFFRILEAHKVITPTQHKKSSKSELLLDKFENHLSSVQL
jgi:site-specific recombinase XerD